MTTYEKIVKGATKIKVAAPKSKYIEPILMATLSDSLSSDNFITIMHTLSNRLQDPSWLVVYKSLIVIHLMIREGDRDVVLKYIASKSPHMLALSTASITRNSISRSDIRFISRYAKYLNTRVVQYDATRIDYVRDERSSNASHLKGGRLRSLSVERGLLRECESVQKQIDALLKSNFIESDVSNDIILTAFRLLVNDLLALFQALNEGVINLLEHYFEMSKVDASRALGIYRKFVDQTKYVVDFLRIAKHLEHATHLHVPTIKHAPTALTSSLEEYLDDPNFEQNRQDYLAEKNLSNKSAKAPQAPAQTIQESQSAMGAPKSQLEPTDQRTDSLIVQQATFNPWAGSVIVPQGFMFVQDQALVGQQAQSQQQQQQQMQEQIQQQQMQQQMQQQQTQQQQMQQQQMQQQQMQQQIQQQAQQQQQQQHVQRQLFQPLQPSVQPLQSTFTGFHEQIHPQLTAHHTSNPFLQIAQQPALEPMMQQQTSSIYQPYQGQVQSPGPGQNQFAQQAAAPMPQLTRNNTNPFLKKTLAPQRTGNNPFKPSEATSRLFNDHFTSSQPQPLAQQPTAGGLERMSTIAVFPETQREAQKQQYLNAAHTGIAQQAYTGHYTPNLMYGAVDSPNLI